MIVCDTGPLLAALNAEDKHHVASLDLLEAVAGPLIVPAPILTEVCYLAGTRLGASAEAAADASVVAVAERLGVTTVANIDHRHFRAVRPLHCSAFELLPL